MTTGWTLSYTDANGNNPVSIPLENMGLNEGGQVLGDGIKLSFKSHEASTLICKIPNVNPSVTPQIPFKGFVTVTDNKGNTQFQGRRIDLNGTADARSKYFEYQFQDLWWDLSKITFKQVWFTGAYQAATATSNVLTFSNAQLGQSNLAAQANLYNAAGTNIGTINITWTSTTQANITSGTFSGTVASATLLYNYPDVVLFQYRPTDPYQKASQVVQYYITTGAEIQEILNFAISVGVKVQIGQINPALYVPWYPVRAVNCAEAIKICLRMHPDCFTEIDYTTTPPTFNVRQRTNLTAVTLPYSYTDTNNREHIATEIKPRPDLQPARVGIYYRYLINGNVISFPQDIYPVGSSDGVLALDYSLDLQGPRITATSAEITSQSFNPVNLAWWQQKCHALSSPDIPTSGTGALQQIVSASNPITVVDNYGNVLFTDTVGNSSLYNGYYEFLKGTVDFWFTGITATPVTVTSYFQYQKKNPITNTFDKTAIIHPQTVRIKLVNSPSATFTFSQYLTTGEAIPVGLAQSIYNSLITLQYELTHKIVESPFGRTFVKPGKNSVNLQGGNSAWQTMIATVQSSEYTLRTNGQDIVFAEATIKCGPVKHLEAGQLVQLFNLFWNRDLSKIDPWERITGIASPSGTVPATDDVPMENSEGSLPYLSKDTLTAPIANTDNSYNQHVTDTTLLNNNANT